jgi:ABC-type sulfate/molybdate transport systems ATPase subunit
VVVSSDIDELVQICDRVLAFSRGRIVAQLTRGEISVEALTRAVGGIAAADERAHAPTRASVHTGGRA